MAAGSRVTRPLCDCLPALLLSLPRAQFLPQMLECPRLLPSVGEVPWAAPPLLWDTV